MVSSDISRDRMILKSETDSPVGLHFYLPCLQQVALKIIIIKSIALFLHDILQSCDFASHARVSAQSVKFVCGVVRGAKCICPVTAFDRHRGSGCPLTPATPPCVRVRTRRFEMVTLARIQMRKPERVEIGVGKRDG
jgi:hypothetical protein